MKTIYTLILASFFLTACQNQQTDLALNLDKGETYKQVTSSKATITQSANGQDITMVMLMDASLSFLVTEIKDNVYHFDANFETITMSMQMPQGAMNFSSEKEDENDIMSSVFKAMTQKTFEVSMSKTGKIINIEDVDLVWNEAINSFDQLSAMQKGQLKAQLMKAYGAEALKGTIEMATAIYPETAVTTGDTWTINTDIESGMSAKMITEYEFVETKADYAVIKGQSTITTTDKKAYVSFNGIDMKYDLVGNMTLDLKVDQDTGWILEAHVNQNIEGDAFIKENAQMPNGLKIPMQMTNATHITN
ncbi:DUF6263 family protein [Formosa algae]|uniref:Uncharacterized protein YcfL n=1 Tax=Formosa algae TaxID=225843 RepID=A0A9X0YMG6_9FLAO|nr:DUF6263 family protein [Formosa algae]MBP1841286.1 uncharacterized protein YcfL [Formosa algae]MDQ0336792.1 uncharacterized protein YcfL [Formosa algae]OEI80565.1 hypothetical protein AST99_08580 [Formosa algae]